MNLIINDIINHESNHECIVISRILSNFLLAKAISDISDFGRGRGNGFL